MHSEHIARIKLSIIQQTMFIGSYGVCHDSSRQRHDSPGHKRHQRFCKENESTDKVYDQINYIIWSCAEYIDYSYNITRGSAWNHFNFKVI